MIPGKKTYLLAAAAVAYALGGWYTGELTGEQAIQWIFQSGFISTIRHALSNGQ